MKWNFLLISLFWTGTESILDAMPDWIIFPELDTSTFTGQRVKYAKMQFLGLNKSDRCYNNLGIFDYFENRPSKRRVFTRNLTLMFKAVHWRQQR